MLNRWRVICKAKYDKVNTTAILDTMVELKKKTRTEIIAIPANMFQKLIENPT